MGGATVPPFLIQDIGPQPAENIDLRQELRNDIGSGLTGSLFFPKVRTELSGSQEDQGRAKDNEGIFQGRTFPVRELPIHSIATGQKEI